MFTKVTPTDMSDGSHFCVRVDSLTTAKFSYIAAQLLKLLERFPIVPP